MKEIKIAIALAAIAAAIAALAEARKIASVRVEDGKIDATAISGDSLTNGASAVSQAISSATNALAEVAHTGDINSLTNAPAWTIRATVDGDGVTRFRIFSTTPTPKGK